MFPRREPKWIGYEETQKQLSRLKQEVEVYEKKIKNGKQMFNEISSRKRSNLQSLSKGPVQLSEKQTVLPSAFVKEILPAPPKIPNVQVYNSINQTVPMEIYSTEEEPNLMPFKYVEPLDLQNDLIRSSFCSSVKLSSSIDSLSTVNSKHSSSEGTSSLIAKTYKDAETSFKRRDTRPTSKPPNRFAPVTSSASDQDMVFSRIDLIEESQMKNVNDIGMEWKEVSSMNPILLRTRFKLDTSKLQHIIDKQKKKQKKYEVQIEDDLPSSFEQLEIKKLKTIEKHQSTKELEEEQIDHVPVRKVCAVKSSPKFYQGFSAPPKVLVTNKKWRKQKSKHTIVKSLNTRTTVIKCQSDIVPNSRWRKVEEKNVENKVEEKNVENKVEEKNVENKVEQKNVENKVQEKNVENKVADLHSLCEDDSSKTLPAENFEETKSEIDDIFGKENDIKVDIQSILKENQLSSEELDVADDETFSKDVGREDSEITKKEDVQRSVQKENKNPLYYKAAKRKAKKTPEKKVHSPKIKPYDVEEVRRFMKKKKEERKKRHHDESRKQILQAQKKKEGLEKLSECQKQIKKTVTKVSSISPTKEKFSHRKEIKNRHIRNAANNKLIMEGSPVQQSINVAEKDSSYLDSFFIRKNEDSVKNEVSEKNDINLIKSRKTKPETKHMDISIPKLTSVSDTPASQHTKTVAEISSKNNRRIAKSENVLPPVESSVPEDLKNKIGEQTEPKQTFKDAKMIDIDDSATYKVVDMFRSISSVSTPSNISHLIGENGSLLAEMKTTEVLLSEIKPQKNESLKDLIKSINMMTKPLEPFLRTKKWIEDNPRAYLIKFESFN